MNVATVDRVQLRSLLIRGEKLMAVAEAMHCSEATVSILARDLGLKRVWLPPAERELLAAIRLVGSQPVDDPAASVALFEIVGRLLGTYQSESRKDTAA